MEKSLAKKKGSVEPATAEVEEESFESLIKLEAKAFRANSNTHPG